MIHGLTDLNDLLQRTFRYALSLTHDRDRAEELVQDACLAVIRAHGPWRIEYMIVVVRNRHVDACRRGGRIRFDPLDGRDLVCSPEALDGRIDADLEAALASLRSEERELLFLAAVEGYTASEIAELTNRPRGTVLSAIHRTKRKLRSLLSRVPETEIS